MVTPRACAAVALLLVAGVAATGCAGAQPEVGPSTVLEIPYLTTRELRSGAAGAPDYSNRVAKPRAGVCRAGIGPGERPNVEIEDLRHETVETVLSSFPAGDVLVYVHGYNIGFERACRDSARLARQTGFEGRLLLFSWPARSAVVTYRSDAKRLAASMPALFDALDELASRYGAGRVNVIAHSMGSRVVVESIEALLPRDEPFDKLVLVAPDIDRELFAEILPELKSLVSEITVLASDRDRLLMLSQTVNLGARLGQADGLDIDGVRVVDVTAIADAGLAGHVYHLSDPEVGLILRGILGGDFPDQASP